MIKSDLKKNNHTRLFSGHGKEKKEYTVSTAVKLKIVHVEFIYLQTIILIIRHNYQLLERKCQDLVFDIPGTNVLLYMIKISSGQLDWRTSV